MDRAAMLASAPSSHKHFSMSSEQAFFRVVQPNYHQLRVRVYQSVIPAVSTLERSSPMTTLPRRQRISRSIVPGGMSASAQPRLLTDCLSQTDPAGHLPVGLELWNWTTARRLAGGQTPAAIGLV